MFKKGDKIECIQGCGGQFTEGKIYTVQQYPGRYGDDRVDVEKDDAGSDTNSWKVEFFKLVEKEKEMAKKKNKVNYIILNSSMILNYEGKTVTVAKDDSRYAAALAALKAGRDEDIPGIVEIERSFEGSGIELRDGLLEADGVAIPSELNDRILKFKDEGLPYGPLLKFWENLKKNPSYNARLMLFKFLEHNGHPLTPDGCFIAYRGVTEDFKDVHSKTFCNKPGSICQMPRELVDDNPNNTCSTGLHVACFDYAKGFGPRLVEVKVNPSDVVAVPTDYNGTKMRVCRFEVVSECANIRHESLVNKEEAVAEEKAKVSSKPKAKAASKNYRHAVRDGNGRFVSK